MGLKRVNLLAVWQSFTRSKGSFDIHIEKFVFAWVDRGLKRAGKEIILYLLLLLKSVNPKLKLKFFLPLKEMERVWNSILFKKKLLQKLGTNMKLCEIKKYKVFESLV